MASEDVPTRARALIGVPFRPQGRDPRHGLDCIGVVAALYGLCGLRRDYTMRSRDMTDAARLHAGLGRSGFVAVGDGAARPGDVAVVQAGPGQLHVVVLMPGGYLHADAGMRKVVEVPGPLPWPVLSAWRHSGAIASRTEAGEG